MTQHSFLLLPCRGRFDCSLPAADCVTYQSRRTGRIVGLTVGIGHEDLHFIPREIASLHVGSYDGLHQLDVVGEFRRKCPLFRQAGVDRLHGSQDFRLFPFRHASESHRYKKTEEEEEEVVITSHSKKNTSRNGNSDSLDSVVKILLRMGQRLSGSSS